MPSISFWIFQAFGESFIDIASELGIYYNYGFKLHNSEPQGRGDASGRVPSIFLDVPFVSILVMYVYAFICIHVYIYITFAIFISD